MSSFLAFWYSEVFCCCPRCDSYIGATLHCRSVSVLMSTQVDTWPVFSAYEPRVFAAATARVVGMTTRATATNNLHFCRNCSLLFFFFLFFLHTFTLDSVTECIHIWQYFCSNVKACDNNNINICYMGNCFYVVKEQAPAIDINKERWAQGKGHWKWQTLRTAVHDH